MSSKKIGAVDLVRSSYEIAWREYSALPGLTPDENMFWPDKLRSYIQVMADEGEQDPIKIARSALGMVREYEQIARSKTRVKLRAAEVGVDRLITNLQCNRKKPGRGGGTSALIPHSGDQFRAKRKPGN
jgi:hypothetical protein